MLYGKYTIEPNAEMQKEAPAIADEILNSLKDKNLPVGIVCYALELAIAKAHETTFTGIPNQAGQ